MHGYPSKRAAMASWVCGKSATESRQTGIYFKNRGIICSSLKQRYSCKQERKGPVHTWTHRNKQCFFLQSQLHLLHQSKFGGRLRDLPALPRAYVESIKQEQLSFLPFLYIQGRPEAASEAAGGPAEQASVTTA